jgi:F0F1-type ATP synthase delta subunit
MLCGCGGASVDYMDMAVEEAAPEAPAMMAAGVANDKLNTSGPNTSATAPENRKWIVTVYMSAETEDLDSITSALDERIRQLDGFVEDQHIYNGSAYSAHRYRSASLTIRIPAEKVDAFTQQVSGIANVVSQEKNLKDVTLTYVSTESRMKALQTEEARLLELMAQAETMSDLLEIEGRLTDVRYELESVTSQLRTFDNQINYATIHLDISEVQEYTPTQDPTLWERISGGFKDSLEALWESLQDLLVGLIIAAPFLVVYGGIALGVFLVIRKLSKHIRCSRDKKRPLKAQKNTKTDAEP